MIFFSVTVLLNSNSGTADVNIVFSKVFVVTCVNNMQFTGFGVVEFKLEDWTPQISGLQYSRSILTLT